MIKVEAEKMINAINIGKRIRVLRKQKHISQERMAEDLGMYQADISNLERAISGSGIADIFKLEMIADYFGITFIELISSANESDVEASENKSEVFDMKNYVIADVKYGEEDVLFVSEVKLISPDRKIQYVSFSEYDDEPRFYKDIRSLYNRLLEDRDNAEHEKELNEKCFLSGEDYIDIFSNVEPGWANVCRYLIFIATEDRQSVEEYIRKTKGKTLEEIEIPIPSREPEDLFNVNYSDLSMVYRYRLMLEASLKNPSVYSDIDNIAKREQAILEKLKEACASEEAYKVWKKDLVDAKVKEVMEKQNIVVCTYLFAGMGQYKEIMPEEMVESFKCWIQHNGSAFFGGSRPATKKEIRTYVSQHIADELLGIDDSID